MVSRTFVHAFDLARDAEDAIIVEPRIAQLAWILKDPKSFAEQGAAPNVTEADVNAAQDMIVYILDLLQRGVSGDLDELRSTVKRLNDDFKGDRKRRRFVDEVKDMVIRIQGLHPARTDEFLKPLLSNLGFWCDAWAFKKLDPAMVKQDVLSIDPHSVGGRGKKGPPWLAARLIVAANAGDEFDLPRPTEPDEDYFDYVLQALQNACRPGRGKPKSSAKKSKATAKKP